MACAAGGGAASRYDSLVLIARELPMALVLQAVDQPPQNLVTFLGSPPTCGLSNASRG
jgi:hypothetical protein